VPVVAAILATVVFPFGPIMPAFVAEIVWSPVALPVQRVTVVRPCLADDQFPAGPVVKVYVLRQPVQGHPGSTVPVIVTARVEVKIDPHMRVVVVIETIIVGIVVTGGVLTGRGADDEQHGAYEQLEMAAHFNPPGPFWGPCAAW
jgi:hypothetical protein